MAANRNPARASNNLRECHRPRRTPVSRGQLTTAACSASVVRQWVIPLTPRPRALPKQSGCRIIAAIQDSCKRLRHYRGTSGALHRNLPALLQPAAQNNSGDAPQSCSGTTIQVGDRGRRQFDTKVAANRDLVVPASQSQPIRRLQAQCLDELCALEIDDDRPVYVEHW
jgi:hypothetical protein